MKRSANRTTGDRLDAMELPKDVRDIIDNTEYRILAEVFGDFYHSEPLVDYVRGNWDIDCEQYTWEELTNWTY
jgi:hypothetical protein